MGSFLVRRLGSTIIVLLGISIITFLLAYAVPADPARVIAGPKASMDTILAIRHQLGLDQPVYMQYVHYLWRLLHGDLGMSYIYNQPVTQLIGERAGSSAFLAISCLLAEFIIGIPLGIYTARRARKFSDYVVSIIALFFVSMLIPFLGEILLYFLGYSISIFPLGGSGGLYYVILPALTYGLTGAAFYTRLLKSSMLEVLNQDYIRTARAKGASERRVVWRHAMRNAIIPVITYAGVDAGMLLGGVVLLEVTFNWNGLGILAFDAIKEMDIPVIMGTVLFTAVCVVLFNLLIDIIYVFIDPRIRYE